MLHHSYIIILKCSLPQCMKNTDRHGFTILQHSQPRKCWLDFSMAKNIPHCFYLLKVYGQNVFLIKFNSSNGTNNSLSQNRCSSLNEVFYSLFLEESSFAEIPTQDKMICFVSTEECLGTFHFEDYFIGKRTLEKDSFFFLPSFY